MAELWYECVCSLIDSQLRLLSNKLQNWIVVFCEKETFTFFFPILCQLPTLLLVSYSNPLKIV